MGDFLTDWYLVVKSLHVVSVVAWMAGLFYLPRLFVYHVEGFQKRGVVPGSEMDQLFQHQERLLFNAIMTPAAVASWIFGLGLAFTPGIVDWTMVWAWTKAFGIVGMTMFHLWLAGQKRSFATGGPRYDGKAYRIMNEVPTVFLLVIVFSVIVKF